MISKKVFGGYVGATLVVAITVILVSCGKNTPEKAESVPVPDGKSLATGTFEGRNDHVVTGNVEIVEAEGKFYLQLGDDFSLDGAPDPRVGLGKDGYRKETSAGALKGKTGASSYELPDGINPHDYNEVFIWCEKFGVPLGVAKLNLSP